MRSFLYLAAFGAAVAAVPASQPVLRHSNVAILLDVETRLAQRGSASVIVGVEAPFALEGQLSGTADVSGQRNAIRAAVDEVAARAAAGGIEVGERFETLPYFTARIDRSQLDMLSRMPGVTSIRENELFRAQLVESVPIVQAPQAWAAGFTGSGWSVAVIDTGIDKTHPFLAGKVTSEACYSGGSGTAPPGFSSMCPGGVFQSVLPDSAVPCTPDPLCGHGTASAGIATGIIGTFPLSGVAHQAGLISIQVSTRVENCVPGGIPCLMFFESDLIRSLERVLVLAGPGNVNRIAAVASSVGSGRFISQASCDVWFSPVKAAMDNLRSIGIPTILPAGNNSYSDGIIAPACISSAVSVGASTKTDELAWYANRAPFLSLLAPGGDGTFSVNGIITSLPGGVFGVVNGSSFSVPHVAGAWAILKQAVPSASVSQVLAALRNGGPPLPDIGHARTFPRLNVNAALQQLTGGGIAGVPGPPGIPSIQASGNFVMMNWAAPVSGGPPANYTVLARLSPGGPIVASLPRGESLSADVTAPNGTFVVSVQASNGFGVGPESSPQFITVPGRPPAPGSPTGLGASVAGSSVHLFWTPPTSGGEPLAYLLFASLTPGGRAIAGLTIPAPSWWTTIPGVPPGTFFLRLAAVNTGGISALSNEVAVTVAHPQLPGPPTMNTPIVIGNTVNLSWSPGAGATPSSYIVRASLTPGGVVIAGFSLAGNAVSIPNVPRGTYFIAVHGVTGAGVGPPSNQVAAAVP